MLLRTLISLRHLVVKGTSILIAFACKSGYSSLILHKNLTSYNVEFKPYQLIFLHSVTLKSFGSPCPCNRLYLLMHFSTLCMHWSFEIHWFTELERSSKY